MENTQTGPPLNLPEPVVDDHVDDADIGRWALVPGGMDWRSFGGVPRRFGIFCDGYVRFSVSDFGLCWGTGGSVRVHFKDIMRRQWDRYRGVRMFSLCGVVYEIADGIPHTGL